MNKKIEELLQRCKSDLGGVDFEVGLNNLSDLIVATLNEMEDKIKRFEEILRQIQ